MTDFVRLDKKDNVVTVTKPVEAATHIENVHTKSLIPRGHKVATDDISQGDPIIKYAQTIGYALEDIEKGAHVHTQNVEFRNINAEYEFGTNRIVPETAARADQFMGFKRDNGKIGTRNFIAIVTSVNCSATAARKIADAFGQDELKDYPNIDGVVAFVHGTGCGMAGRWRRHRCPTARYVGICATSKPCRRSDARPWL